MSIFRREYPRLWHCRHCGEKLQKRVSMLGPVFRCPQCGAVFVDFQKNPDSLRILKILQDQGLAVSSRRSGSLIEVKLP